MNSFQSVILFCLIAEDFLLLLSLLCSVCVHMCVTLSHLTANLQRNMHCSCGWESLKEAMWAVLFQPACFLLLQPCCKWGKVALSSSYLDSYEVERALFGGQAIDHSLFYLASIAKWQAQEAWGGSVLRMLQEITFAENPNIRSLCTVLVMYFYCAPFLPSIPNVILQL